ncbi:MAG: 4Fe-4S dicluster domain-containing protein [Nanoarchaeota archaeon]|nr:4Fe-4S dicluster domain-containing protein [Nanoarchaeota archaeon]
MIKCIECGLCKEVCPVFRVLKRESVSPRGFAILQNKEVYNKMFYMCSLCNNCKVVCPYKVDLKLLETREEVNKESGATDKMKEIIENLRKSGNIYGE